jgi:hypothetical protein
MLSRICGVDAAFLGASLRDSQMHLQSMPYSIPCTFGTTKAQQVDKYLEEIYSAP